jgi:hypothetical protein
LLAACSVAAINVEGNVAGAVTAVEGTQRPPAAAAQRPAHAPGGTSAGHARAGSAAPYAAQDL